MLNPTFKAEMLVIDAVEETMKATDALEAIMELARPEESGNLKEVAFVRSHADGRKETVTWEVSRPLTGADALTWTGLQMKDQLIFEPTYFILAPQP